MEQVAWTLGVFACRRDSRDTQTIPGSGATFDPEHLNLSLRHPEERTSPLLDGVQVQYLVQCRVPSPDFLVNIKTKSLYFWETRNQTTCVGGRLPFITNNKIVQAQNLAIKKKTIKKGTLLT